MAGWFARSAATLHYLEQQGYPAPRVIPTRDDALTCTHHGWTALMLTFVPGELIAYSAGHLHALGAMLAQLHCVDVAAVASALPAVPDARFGPGRALNRLLADLLASSSVVPALLQSLYDRVVADIHEVETWTDMPDTLVHCDCWPTNAIYTPQDQVILIDWDGYGLGAPLLDLGYLLATCQLQLGVPPEREQVHPQRIHAVLEGYEQQRKLALADHRRLPAAVRFGGAYHTARFFAYRLPAGVQDESLFMKIQSRYALALETATTMRQYLA